MWELEALLSQTAKESEENHADMVRRQDSDVKTAPALAPKEGPFLVLVDDTMHLRSMRKRVARLAAACECLTRNVQCHPSDVRWL